MTVGVKRCKIAYGDHPSQFGHLYIPALAESEQRAPLVVVVHGGSWSTEFGLTIETAVARDLAIRGAAVWNVEYRRIEEGGGWPTTGRDVIAALQALDGPVAEALALAGARVDRTAVSVIGHSAGGQLATWSVARLGARTAKHRIALVVPQSGVLDLTLPGARDRASLVRFLGATYDEAPERYRDASPAHAPVTDATVAVVHTIDDESVPVELSRHYAELMTGRGQTVSLTEVPGDHAAFLDLRGLAHRATLRVLGL
ncbi:alpha/beta hydrolase family protein [Gordonia sp. (in: high G+C Gram-positive bacteria)]|uniref:alpha/beta hydrolase family protein n=1 Tax=unclassified Gordonia (in: high G+C Gram-positive bacteria) TaxID=2657482 RepID=UPI0035297B84